MEKNNAGAVASNAGDDFHLIWACKKLLEIIKPNSELMAISVEGPVKADFVQIEDEDKLYSIDLAEYYGGEIFSQAHRIVFSQLKYSAYQMRKSWTASNLCSSTNGNNSIIRRLADTYIGFLEKYENVNEKLILKLVSNRSLQPQFLSHINECVTILNKNRCKNTATLMKRLPDECKEDIDKLYKTSQLSSSAFVGFLQVLDFRDCGTNIRSIHKAEIIRQLGNWNIRNIRSKYSSLIRNLREMMLPESELGIPLNKDFVFAALESSSYELFPAPVKIEMEPSTYIKRSVGSEIARCIKEKQKNIICLQATAGAGKTTLVSHIQDFLPDESVAVLYDCYGGGSFLQYGERRHLVEIAIPQISNTLATECGTEWIIGHLPRDYEYWRLLNERLATAVSYVKKQNSSAIVAIIIDAADNSMVAAKTFQEECFLEGLLSQQLPEDVWIIVTTRTERRDLIPFTNEVEVIDVPPFELCESSKHIRSVFENATDAQCEQFHVLTDRNPRLQAYMLSNAKSVHEMLSQIRPTGKTMDSLFKEFIDVAQKQYKSIVDFTTFFSALIQLPRPIPINFLCELCCITNETLTSISIECRRGFYVVDSFIFLKDEDFETYLRSHYEDSKEVIKKIADYMYQGRKQDAYCARYVHIFLDKADCFSQLISIALDEDIDAIVIGIAQLSEIKRQRIQCALKRREMCISENYLMACKLVYRLIDVNANGNILREFLESAPDETALYCDEVSAYNVFHSVSNDFDSLGKAALVFSHFPIYQEYAEQYINSYLANAYYNKDVESRGYHSKPKTTDIVNIAEAMLRQGEIEKSVKWITGWSPRIAAVEFVYEFFSKLISYDYCELYHSLLLQQWTVPNKLAIVCAFISAGKLPPKAYVEYLKKVFIRMYEIPMKRFDSKHLLTFMEYLLHSEASLDIVIGMVGKFSVKLQCSNRISIYRDDEQEELSNALRYYALMGMNSDKSIILDDILKDKESIKQTNVDKETLTNILEFLSPIYLFRLTCIQNNQEIDYLRKCNELISSIERRSWNFYTYDRHKLLEMGLLVLAESICYVSEFKAKEIKKLITKIFDIKKMSPQFKLEILKRLVVNNQANSTSVAILREIDNLYEMYPAAAKEMSEIYLSCSKLGKRIDNELGKKYFAKAMESTKEIDYESYRKMYLYRTLAERMSDKGVHDSFLSYKVIRLSEDFCRKMEDTKNFPYHEAISGAVLLSPESIWGALCRIDDRDNHDGFSLQNIVPIVLETMLEADCISVENIVALMGLLLPDLSYDYRNMVAIVLQKLSFVRPKQQKPILEILMHDVLYSVPMDEKQYIGHQIVEYINSNVVSPELNTNKIRAMDNFLGDKQDLFKDNNTIEDKEIQKQLTSEKSIVSKQMLKEEMNKMNSAEREAFVMEWLEMLQPDKYTESINWLIELISDDYYHFGSSRILHNITDFIESVKMLPQVDRWRNDVEIQKRFLQAFSREFLDLHGGYDDLFDEFLSIFPAKSSVQYEAILEYVSNHINLYDEQLVKAVCRMTVVLSVEETTELLKEILNNEVDRVHPASGDGENCNPEKWERRDDVNSLAYFIWRLLGHKDKGLRCKAAHVLMRISFLGNLDYLVQISKLYDIELSHEYLDENNFFFIESAKTWYLATCLRIGKKCAEQLVPLYPFFEAIACEKEVIHALQRKMAKEICLQIAPYCEPDKIEIIMSCDDCAISDSHIMRKTHYWHRRQGETLNCKFHFDTMDTLRYWYDDVAELFMCSEEDVAMECDYFVAQFGITNQSAREWNTRYIVTQEDSHRTSNSHGFIPTVETLEKYAEWHSMFYVADKYRQTRGQIKDENSSYENWLSKFMPGKDGFWCFEFRNHVPFIPFLWDFTIMVENTPKRKYYIPNDFALSLIDHNLGVTLDMEYSAYFEQSIRHVRIDSAFIVIEDIEKLVKKMKKPNLVLSDFSVEHKRGNSGELVTYPTCDVIATFPDYALDQKDMLLKDYLTYSNYLMGLSDDFAKDLCVTQEEQFLHSRIYDASTYPVQTYHWSEPESESGYDRHSTYGNMVVLKKDCLAEILKKRNQALIIDVTISFEDSSYRFYGSPSKPAKERKLFSLEINPKDGMIISKQLAILS